MLATFGGQQKHFGPHIDKCSGHIQVEACFFSKIHDFQVPEDLTLTCTTFGFNARSPGT